MSPEGKVSKATASWYDTVD